MRSALSPAPPPSLQTLAQKAHGSAWRMELLHETPVDQLIWITRGQGRAVLHGVRSGIGPHNALFIPAGSLFALDIGKQGYGLVVRMPASDRSIFGHLPAQLRIRDNAVQTELTGILDAMQREQSAALSYHEDALHAHGALLSVWLRRQALDFARPKFSAAHRLVMAYADVLASTYRSGAPMAAHAAALDVTPTHLTRCCKQVCGMTAADMLTQVTLHAARQMVEGSAQPLNQIGASLGFRSAAYFSRFVSHHTGQSPSALRAASRLAARKG